MKLGNVFARLASVLGLTIGAGFHAKESVGAFANATTDMLKAARSNGCGGNIAYRESCRTTNQRKKRKAFRQLLAAGGV